MKTGGQVLLFEEAQNNLEGKMGKVIMLAIKSKYAAAILADEKTFEFRKKFPQGIRTVYLYATAPVSKVVGLFSPGEITYGLYYQLWHISKGRNGVTKEELHAYFGDRYGYAIEIYKGGPFFNPKQLSHYGIARAPQSYCFLKEG